ncbi:hypothetical protein, partial [Pseudomonas paraeruginosa]
HALSLATFLGIAVMVGTAHGKNVKPSLPDWQTLAFTCTTEQNPPVDPQADAWLPCSGKAVHRVHDAEMLRLYKNQPDPLSVN